MSEIQIVTGLFASRQQILRGSPPQQIPTDSTALADLGIKLRELFTVTERSQSTTPTRAQSQLHEAVKVDIPGDDSACSTPSANLPLHRLEEPRA
jgi:hypothetical protein